jgi:hypothetical protein
MRKTLIEEIKEFQKSLTPRKAKSFLIKAGILTKKGNLKRIYK